MSVHATLFKKILNENRNSCLLSAALLGLAFSSGFAESQQTGGTLNLIVQPEPITLNPGINRLGPATFVGYKIYDTLVSYQKDMKPIPRLAESWSVSPDGLTYTFKLRKGVTWHDGAPFTSKDVAFSFNEFLPANHGRSRDLKAEIARIETPDDLTAVFVLKAPYPAFLSALNSPVEPAHKYQGVTDFRTAPANAEFIGTGPFKVAEWKRGSLIRLVRNDKYWDAGKPYLDGINFNIIPDANSRAIAFETGEVHALRAGDVENFDIARLAALSGVSIREDGWEYLQPVGYVNVNSRSPILAKLPVRQAIVEAIDRDFIINTIFAGFGKPINGPLSRYSAYKDTSVETVYAY